MEPTVIIDLIEHGAGHPDAARLFNHIAGCPYCRRQYLEIEENLRSGAQARSGQSALTLSEIHASPPAADREMDRIHFDFSQMAASTTRAFMEASGAYCGGALRATLWLDEGNLVLTVENHPQRLWQRTGGGGLESWEGDGAPLAGELFAYELTTPAASIQGYVVLPQSAGVTVAEIEIEAQGRLQTGELAIRLSRPEELSDPEPVTASIARSRDTATRDAWTTYAVRHQQQLSEPVLQAISQSAGS